MVIQVCIFKREEDSLWESGISTESDTSIIIDKSGKVVESIYDIKDRNLDFLVNISPILEIIEKSANS